MRVGVIGAGNMGRNHLRVLSSMTPRVEVAGVADPSIEALAAIQGHGFAVPKFNNYMDMLPGVDAVVVATPTPSHYQVVRACLLARKHVLVEKPITMERETAQELVNLARRFGLVLQVGHIERFNPVVRQLKTMIAGEPVVACEADRLSYFQPSTAYGNLVVDLMIHDIDVLLFLLDNQAPERVMARAYAATPTDPDHVAAILGYGSGTVATLTVSRLAHEKLRRLRLYTPRKTFTLNYITREMMVSNLGLATTVSDPSARGYRVETGHEFYVLDGEPLAYELGHFVDCVTQDRESEVNGAVGLRALDIALQVYNQVVPMAPSSTAD